MDSSEQRVLDVQRNWVNNWVSFVRTLLLRQVRNMTCAQIQIWDLMVGLLNLMTTHAEVTEVTLNGQTLTGRNVSGTTVTWAGVMVDMNFRTHAIVSISSAESE